MQRGATVTARRLMGLIVVGGVLRSGFKSVLLLGLLLGAASASSDEVEALRGELEALKAGQAEIRSELAEIKKLLTPRRREPVQDAELVLNVADDPSKGQRGARIAMVEFTDYQCPFCARHVKSVHPNIQEDYIDSGKLRYFVRDFPLSIHKDAPAAAAAAHCAGEQKQYWAMHDALFDNQKALKRENLEAYAADIGLNGKKFTNCLDSGKYDEMVAASLQEGTDAGIRGTPSFALGVLQNRGREVKVSKIIRGAVGYQTFRDTIEALLKAEE